MSTFLVIKKTFDLSASNNTQILVSRQFSDKLSIYDAQIEYLEGTGTQWIDTNISGSSEINTEIDFATTSVQSEKGIFGSLGTPRQCLILAGNQFRYDLGQDESTIKYTQTTQRRKVVYNGTLALVSDSIYGSVQWDGGVTPDPFSSTPDTMTIFVDKSGGTITSSRIASMRLYRFRMWNQSGTLIDLIPVRSGNIGYMYDRVSRSLFGNQGAGNFVLGQDIPNITTMKKHFDYAVDVSFDSAGGTACASSTYVLGKTYQNLPTTTRSSHIFQGWYTQLTGGTQISAESTVELSTTTLYAQWKYVDVGDDYTEYVVQTTSSYKKTGIYSATRYSAASPIVVDWGDGNVEAIEGNISQLAHEYSSVSTFHVKFNNTTNFQPSYTNTTWFNTTSQNRYTFKDVVRTGSHCTSFLTYAFYYCAALSSINFLSSCFTSLTTIPNYSFSYCQSIKQLSSLPSRIKTLGAYSFQYCTGLSGIQDLRNTGLTSFTQSYIFANCTGVKEFKLPNSIGATCGMNLFSNSTGLSSFTIPTSLTATSQNMLYGCTGLKDITIPSNIKSIGSSSFRGCTTLSSITYETTALTSINQNAFYQNYALRDLNVPDTVKLIGNYAFYYCYSTYASSLVLPSALTSLGTYAYRYCYNLKSLTIPSGLTGIQNYAFAGCRSLSSITDYRLTAQTTTNYSFGTTTGTGTNAYTGYSTRGSNKLRIYSNATGYDSSYWLDPLQNSSKCGFSIEYIGDQIEPTGYHTVTFDPGIFGSLVNQSDATRQVANGQAVGEFPTVSSESYYQNLTGWYTEQNGSGYEILSSTIITADITCYGYGYYNGGGSSI